MTRYIILSAFFLVVFSCNYSSSFAGTKDSKQISIADNIDIDKAVNSESAPVKSLPALPGAQPMQPVEKTHGQNLSMDELAHIHHFHKERVKKIKKHHKKCWTMSKLILVLCHIAMLVIAFMHITH